MKTTLLLATLTAILVVLGDMIGGRTGMMAMFVVSMGMNFMSYWFSDKIVLAHITHNKLLRNLTLNYMVW